MQKELLRFIASENISPFSEDKMTAAPVKSVYQTSHAKAIHNKVIQQLSRDFSFRDTDQVFRAFQFTTDPAEIKKRQDFFATLQKKDYYFLEKIKKNKQKWHPPYGLVVATANDSTFLQLKSLDCPARLILSENDVGSLEQYDVVQAIDVEEYERLFEQLPNVVFADSLDDIYLERYLIELSEWREIIKTLSEQQLPTEIQEVIMDVSSHLDLLSELEGNNIKRESIESALVKINAEVSAALKNMTLSGDALLGLMNKGSLPIEISSRINQAITDTKIPSLLFNKTLPVTIDEDEVEKILRQQEAQKFTKRVESLQKKSNKLRKLPEQLKKIEQYLVFLDFISGISNYMDESMEYPVYRDYMSLNSVSNIFLENAQPISFTLHSQHRCSILTGANSGGKTTLLEHIIQLNSLFQLGLPVKGELEFPLFSDVYYFAKTKGSANKGAFETLLAQMSTISPGEHTLILADEIEVVTEPGVAGMIISATADYFIKQNCFLVIATHLGHEIQNVLPEKARIDGIEAKGLDEEFNLIVDHNPVLGRLAHSTPELIVERLAKSKKEDYFTYLHQYLNEHKK